MERATSVQGRVGAARATDPSGWFRALCAGAIALAGAVAPLGGQGAPVRELLTGRITAAPAQGVAGATVTVTRAPDRRLFTTTTDAQGAWRIVVESGYGDYLVAVRAIGYSPDRMRVTSATATLSPDGSRLLRADIELERIVPPTLASVEIRATRPRMPRGFRMLNDLPEVGSNEQSVGGFAAALSPAQAGDLTATLATVPGVVGTPSGPAVFGLGASQNAVTIGGLNVRAGALPRDLRTSVRVSTSTYDPANGWFAGAQTAVELSPGTPYVFSQAHLTVDAPALQLTDAVGRRGAGTVTGLQASGTREGGLRGDRLTYSVAGQASRRASPGTSLLSAHPSVLDAAGVPRSAASSLANTLGALGIPTAAAAGTGWGAQTTDRVLLAGRLGTPVYDYETGEIPARISSVSLIASGGRTDAAGLDPRAVETRAARAEDAALTLQAQHSRYAREGRVYLEARSGVSGTMERTAPLVRLPGLQVQVESMTDVGRGLVPLTAGGDGTLASSRQRWLWETQGQLAVLPARARDHQVTLSGAIRLDAASDRTPVDRFGTYTFASLDDLADGRAARFTRTLGDPRASAMTWNGFLALGDEWRVGPALRVLGGLRLDGTVFGTRPPTDGAVAQAFGLSTGTVPNGVALSPRLGFRWRRRVASDGIHSGRFGMFAVPRASYVSGGIGRFRSLLGPEYLLPVRETTGGAGLRLLDCVGVAAPIPTWDAWESGTAQLPTTCAQNQPALAAQGRAMRVLASDLTAPDSWRANLAWTTQRWGLSTRIEGTVAWHRHQLGQRDHNLREAPAFTTADGRAVFATPDGIDPRTGVVSPTTARRDPAFGPVLELDSRLRARAEQLAVTIQPLAADGSRAWLSGTYVLGRVRQEAYAGSAATWGDPRARSWARGDADVRHQFVLQGGVLAGPVSIAVFGRVASGQPFSPIFAQDVNGDGVATDAVVLPSVIDSVADPQFAAGVAALRASGPAHVRACLDQPRGAPLGRNSCRGPWTATLNLRIGLEGRALGLGPRARVSLNLENPLSGLDALLHGERLRGWGAPAAPDPRVGSIVGFEPTTRRFLAAVNPRFGDTRPQATTLRAPFRVTLDVTLDLAPSIPRQQVDKWFGRHRRGKPLTADALRARYARAMPDPYRDVLAESDSLFLSATQDSVLRVRQTRWRAQVDSAWRDLAESLASLRGEYDGSDVVRRQNVVADAVWELARREAQAVLPQVLTPTQQALLTSGTTRTLLSAQVPIRRPSHVFF